MYIMIINLWYIGHKIRLTELLVSTISSMSHHSTTMYIPYYYKHHYGVCT